MNISDKLLDLYGISFAEAKLYWRDAKYIDVLKDKITKGERLKTKLVDVNMMIRDMEHIKRVSKAIQFNTNLLLEVGYDNN